MIEFIIAVVFLLITPGPGVLTTAGIGAAFGYRAGFGFVGGLMLGGFINMMIVISGLAALVLAVPSLRTVLLIASVAYLLYLAWRIASAGAKVGFAPAETPLGFKNGLMLQFINPKAYVVNTTLFSGFVIFQGALVAEVAIKFLIVNAIWIPIHLGWLWMGAAIKHLNLPPKTQRTINVLMALALVLVVGLAAWSALR